MKPEQHSTIFALAARIGSLLCGRFRRTLVVSFTLALVLTFAGPAPGFGGMGISFGVGNYRGGPYWGPAGYYGWPYGGFYHGYRPYHRRGWYGGNWIEYRAPVYPRRYYEQGHIRPEQPYPDITGPVGDIHKAPIWQTYQEQGLGLDTILPSGGQQEAPAPDPAVSGAGPQGSLREAGQPQSVIYPVMTRESREAWERWQGWIRHGVPVKNNR